MPKPRTPRTLKTIPNDIDPAEHLGLVYQAAGRLAAKFRGQVGEFVGESYIALVAAKRTYNPAKGYRFSTHAVRAIRFRAFGGVMQERGAERVHGKGWKARRGVELFDHHPAPTPDRPAPGATTLDIDRLAEFADRVTRHGAEVVRMRAKGMKLREIAAALGLTRQRIKQVVDDVHEAVQARWKEPLPEAVA